MNDLIMIVIRFLLYLDLMVIFGLPFFQIYGISGVRHETYNLTNFRSFITFAVVTGIILTGINMLLVSNAMSGVTDLRELSIHVIEMVIEETDVGIREGANKQVISSQADSLIKISRIWADFFPANTSNQPI
ncbi:copper resistance protein D [Klebsiella pneumoniae CHS 57]|nr:copper resistance protein D [Klebsiella pneumoniae CHS 57]